ncbi:MAG: hypothetical protein ISQ87_04790 [Rhodobacteraceae bacterium]|nr:hypothetical protein [Paracoccaceae bacterium]MBL6675764.1 hypothetical protein [Paracoccaceae bacterium]MBL6859278.1 hypothetical protein [Paracoccaceae bacterium]
MGLAICPKLVSLMGGDIWVEASACGGGLKLAVRSNVNPASWRRMNGTRSSRNDRMFLSCQNVQ